MTGVENILLRPPRSERKVPTGLATFEWVGAGGRRGRWSNAAKPPAPGVLAFWVAVARWGRRSASPRPLSGPGSRQPGWDTQGWEAGLHGHTRPLTEVSVLRAHSPSGSRGVQPSLRHRAPWAAKG